MTWNLPDLPEVLPFNHKTSQAPDSCWQSPKLCHPGRHAVHRVVLAALQAALLSMAPLNVSNLHRDYMRADPFPHIYFDDVFPSSIFTHIDREMPDGSLLGPLQTCRQRAREGWRCIHSPRSGNLKVSNSRESRMGPTLQGVIMALKSDAFISFLQGLTGIYGLHADPYNEGSGLHQIFANGSLRVHADFNKHPVTGMERRVNVFLYLNDGWDQSWGGDLELWNRAMTRCAARIAAVRNRLAIFSTTDFTYHGHPDPLKCPLHRSRRSIAQYYYSPYPRPQAEMVGGERHSTLYQTRKCATCQLPQCRVRGQYLKASTPSIRQAR